MKLLLLVVMLSVLSPVGLARRLQCDLVVSTTYRRTTNNILMTHVSVSNMQIGAMPGREMSAASPGVLVDNSDGIFVPVSASESHSMYYSDALHKDYVYIGCRRVELAGGIYTSGQISAPIVGIDMLMRVAEQMNRKLMLSLVLQRAIFTEGIDGWRSHFRNLDVETCVLKNCTSPFSCAFPAVFDNADVGAVFTLERAGVGVPPEWLDTEETCHVIKVGGVQIRACKDVWVCVTEELCGIQLYGDAQLVNTSFVRIGMNLLQTPKRELMFIWDPLERCGTIDVAWDPVDGMHMHTTSSVILFTLLVMLIVWMQRPESSQLLIDELKNEYKRTLYLLLRAVVVVGCFFCLGSAIYGTAVEPTLHNRLRRSSDAFEPFHVTVLIVLAMSSVVLLFLLAMYRALAPVEEIDMTVRLRSSYMPLYLLAIVIMSTGGFRINDVYVWVSFVASMMLIAGFVREHLLRVFVAQIETNASDAGTIVAFFLALPLLFVAGIYPYVVILDELDIAPVITTLICFFVCVVTVLPSIDSELQQLLSAKLKR